MLTALSIHASEGKLGLCKQERIGIIMHHVESIRTFGSLGCLPDR